MHSGLLRRAVRPSVWLIALATAPAFVPCAGAQTLTDSRLSYEMVAQLPPYEPVGVTWAPDGRLFVWQRSGAVRIVQNGTLLSTPFLDIRGKVNLATDRGMLGFALDPEFATNGYAYVFYVYENGPDPNSTGPKTGRLSRFTVDPGNPNRVLPGSETIILGTLSTPPCSQYPAGSDCFAFETPTHAADTIRFAEDGSLFVSVGDGSDHSGLDSRSLGAQRLNNYMGKILRIARDGSALPDNPFYDGTNSIRSKIYAYGLRNPFRFSFHPTSGEPIIGDVGLGTWEEIDIGRGANFGWPCYEGPDPRAVFASSPECQALGAGDVTPAALIYGRTQGQSVTGGPVYVDGPMPAEYHGQYFFGDYTAGWIRRGTIDPAGQVVNVQPFAAGLGGPVAIEVGPDGWLYVVSFVSGTVRRVVYAASAAPVAEASATPTSGYSPLAVQFSSAGSRSPGGSALTYLWDFGDGATSTAPNPTHTYTAPGVATYTARLTVRDTANRTGTATVRIVVGSQPPVPTISQPAQGVAITTGQVLAYAGDASDPDQALPETAFRWQVLLHHDAHVHPHSETIGRTGSFVVDAHNPDGGSATYWYELVLTVTDSTGLSASKRVSTAVVSSGGSLPSVRINAGGGGFTDSQGRAWAADSGFNTGSISTYAAVTGPDALLYNTQRWDPLALPDLAYTIPLPPGRYRVSLHFAECYGGTAAPGARVFAVALEGHTVMPLLDIYAAVGFARPLVKSFTLDVDDGALNVGFEPIMNSPSIAGIEVVPDGAAPPPPPPPPPPAAEVRINAGGGGFTDSQGRAWSVDRNFNTGATSNSGAVTGPDAPLYNAQRWDPAGAPELAYAIPLPAGRYRVSLHFAETYGGAARVGGRVFDVRLEGQTRLSRLDVFAEVGFGKPLVKSITLDVQDGTLNLDFVHVVENPSVAAIEVVPDGWAPPPPPPPPPTGAVRVNAGGPAFTDSRGRAWEADRNFNTGLATSSSAYAGTDAPLYGTERWDPGDATELVYSFPVDAGSYEVKLHFAEIYSGAARVGGRVFDVSIEGVKVLDGLDIYAQAGYLQPLVKTLTTTVSDGQLTIAFAHRVENPKLSGIEFVKLP